MANRTAATQKRGRELPVLWLLFGFKVNYWRIEHGGAGIHSVAQGAVGGGNITGGTLRAGAGCVGTAGRPELVVTGLNHHLKLATGTFRGADGRLENFARFEESLAETVYIGEIVVHLEAHAGGTHHADFAH